MRAGFVLVAGAPRSSRSFVSPSRDLDRFVSMYRSSNESAPRAVNRMINCLPLLLSVLPLCHRFQMR